MSHINTVILDSERLPLAVQAIERQLTFQTTLDLEGRNGLHSALEDVSRSVEQLRRRANQVDAFAKSRIAQNLDGLDDKIVTLYGRIDTVWVDSEISTIAAETRALNAEMEQEAPNREEIVREVNQLKKHINTLCRDHRLLKKDRKVVGLARATIKRAEAVLTNKILGNTFNQLNLLALQARPLDDVYADEEIDEQVSELFPLANLFYKNNLKEAMRGFNQLSDFEKARFRSHLKQIGASSLEPADDCQKTAKALIALAYELSDSCSEEGEIYLSDAALDQFCTEADQA